MMENREKSQKPAAAISVSPDVKETLRSLKRGNESYNDVLEPILAAMTISESGEGIGAVFLKSVYVGDDLKNLKKQIPLKVVVDENNSLILSNNEYKILVVCDNIVEGLEDARLQFADLFDIYTDDAPMTEGAIVFGQKLKAAVWM